MNSCNNQFLLKLLIACFPYHVFPHSLAQWTIPTVTGYIPPPTANFSFTQISSGQAVMFGGTELGIPLSELYLATVGRESVVCA